MTLILKCSCWFVCFLYAVRIFVLDPVLMQCLPVSCPSVSQRQPLQQLLVVKKQSVCIKKKEETYSDLIEVSN